MAGFNSMDGGGPFRESIAMLVDDLQSSALPLFLPTPNHRQNVGSRRCAYLPNPASRGEAFAEMYVCMYVRRLRALRVVCACVACPSCALPRACVCACTTTTATTTNPNKSYSAKPTTAAKDETHTHTTYRNAHTRTHARTHSTRNQ